MNNSFNNGMPNNPNNMNNGQFNNMQPMNNGPMMPQVPQQPQMPQVPQQTVVNNQLDNQKKNEIIEKYLPKIMKANSKNNSMALLIIGGLLLVLSVVAYFAMEDSLIFIMFGVIFGIMFVIFGLVYNSKFKKRIPVDFNAVRDELYATDSYLIEPAKVFFTKNYLVSYSNDKFALPYKEIVYAYMQRHQQNTNVSTNSLLGNVIIAGVEAAVSAGAGHMDIVIKTANGGSHLFFAAKQEEEILYLIQKYNPTCLIGDSKENNQAYKEIKNNYKNNVANQQMQQPPVQQVQQPIPQPVQEPVQQVVQQPVQQPMMNQPVQPVVNPQPVTQPAQPMPTVNNGPIQPVVQQPQMPQQPPMNNQYTPLAGQPRSYSGNLNDQSTFNRF